MSDRLFFGKFGVTFTFHRGGNTEIVYATRWISINIKQQLEYASQKRFDLCQTAALQKGKCEVEGDLLYYTSVHFGGQQTSVENCVTNMQKSNKLEKQI